MQVERSLGKVGALIPKKKIIGFKIEKRRKEKWEGPRSRGTGSEIGSFYKDFPLPKNEVSPS